jgi:hypothetical protein
MKIKRIKIPIYFGTLVIINDKNLEYTDKIEKKYDIGPIDKYDGFVFENPNSKFFELVVVMRTDNPSIIAHECVHLTNRTFNNVRQKLHIKNDEAQAYLTGWFFDKIYKFINK